MAEGRAKRKKPMEEDMRALLAFVRRGCSGVTPIPEEMLPELTGELGVECARAMADCDLFAPWFREQAEAKLFELQQQLEESAAEKKSAEGGTGLGGRRLRAKDRRDIVVYEY
jgi:hypothetical protein